MKPFAKYFGSKVKFSSGLPAPDPALPIIEPFAGMAGYSVVHGEGRQVWLNDMAGDVITLWTWMRDASPEEIFALPVEQLEFQQDIRELGLPLGAALFIRNHQRVGRTNWKVSKWGNRRLRESAGLTCKGDSGLWGETAKMRLISQQRHIKNWVFTQWNYADLPDIDANWVVDPPYQGQYANVYKNCSPIDYAALGAWCMSRRGRVTVHENEGANWLPFREFCASKSQITSLKRGKEERPKEMIWMNF